MRPRTWVLGLGVLVAVVVAAVVLAEEKTERVSAPGVSGVQASSGEWIGSVPGVTADVWAVGDADPPRSGRVARIIRRTDPDRILYLGDVYLRGTRDDFRRWAKPFGRLVRRMAPTPGNHDWPNARRGYNPFWRRVTGETPPPYYSFSAGGWEVLGVNGEHPNRDAVERWLRKRVAAGGDCRIAFWHRPRYTAGHHEGGNERVTAYWEALERRARLLVHGHEHNLQRMEERDGIVQLISGAGGRKLYSVDERYPGLAFSDERHHGALRLLLSPSRAEWRFVAANGSRLDSGSVTCRA